MSTVLKPVIAEREQNITSSSTLKEGLLSDKTSKYGLKCKENIFKHKCNKALKNKLKKYKLRRDGKEDPEVINVSHILQCSLKIRSPTNNNNKKLNCDSEAKPRNYLSKMARRKRVTDKVTAVKAFFKEAPKENNIVEKVIHAENDHVDLTTSNSQDKKQTNAFQLMMESRNKSIGGNSPGKEKTVDEAELQLLKEEKNNKAKRRLVLQKMAEAKGSLKNKEKEKLVEEAIKKKMEKRAEKLTKMLVNNGNTKAKKEKTTFNKKPTSHTPDKKEVDNEEQGIKTLTTGSLQLINMFNEPVENTTSIKCFSEKQVLEEDIEFLKKLSPSIRKKENMLCYFKKLEKDDEYLISTNTENFEDKSPVIKVKFASRNKGKIKKKKLSLKSEKLCEIQNEIEITETIILDEHHAMADTETNFKSSRKRKREQMTEVKDVMTSENIDSVEIIESRRPKRNVKKPIQYTDFDLSSSDEEYNIFTPEKKKHMDRKIDTPKSNKESTSSGSTVNMSTKLIVKVVEKPIKNKDVKEKNNVKLAPIFAPKPQLDPAVLEAKQKFLQSGVPDKLKKIASQQTKRETENNCFPTVVHIQQTVTPDNASSNSLFIDLMKCDSDSDFSPIKCPEKVLKAMLSPEKCKKHRTVLNPDKNVKEVLKNIKNSYPKFPVYRTYNLLKAKSKGDFCDSPIPELDNSIEIINNIEDIGNVPADKLNWTDKYKPVATNQIIGNFETTKELKKWLESWTARGKISGKADSDSSDFCYSDTDSKDSMKTTDNLLILTGPTGCGKTSCVYAVAADLAIKVIEVNASSKRNGKIMLQDLQEATQSHKVNRTKGSSAENSQKSQEVIDVDLTVHVKKRGRPKKYKDLAKPKDEVLSQSTNSQETVGTGMSLILIDDADIIFDQDEGFCSAISQLIQYSKRPVILVTTSLVCPHLQRFLLSGKIMTMKPLLPRMLGTWLDIMCLADSGTCWPGLGAVLLDLFQGDIRKTINCLQFYASTHMEQDFTQKEKYSQNSEIFLDENSSTSWTGSENQEDRYLACAKSSIQEAGTMWKYLLENNSNLLHIRFPSDLWNVWWNLPSFLNNVFDSPATEDPDDKRKQIRQLSEMANIANNISAVDYFSRLRPDARANISSQPWYSSECDGSSEYENLGYYNRSYDLNDDLSQTLVVRSICHAQKCLDCDDELNFQPTRMAVQRDRDRVVSRHDSISTHLNPAATLDRRALALDYWSSCRTICRFEKAKTDTNSKRNNRFCHYLKSLKIICKNDVYDKLGESLNAKEQ